MHVGCPKLVRLSFWPSWMSPIAMRRECSVAAGPRVAVDRRHRRSGASRRRNNSSANVGCWICRRIFLWRGLDGRPSRRQVRAGDQVLRQERSDGANGFRRAAEPQLVSLGQRRFAGRGRAESVSLMSRISRWRSCGRQQASRAGARQRATVERQPAGVRIGDASAARGVDERRSINDG